MRVRLLGVAVLAALLALPAAQAQRPEGPRQDETTQNRPDPNPGKGGPNQDSSQEAKPGDDTPGPNGPAQPNLPDVPDAAVEASLKAQEEGSRSVLDTLELLGVAQAALDQDPLETEVDWNGKAAGALGNRGVGPEKVRELRLLVAAERESRRLTEALLVGLLGGDLSALEQPELLPQEALSPEDLSALGNVPPDDD